MSRILFLNANSIQPRLTILPHICVSASSTHLKELHTLFAGEEELDKFTEEMVKQFMKEEEVRAQHQVHESLLRCH